MPKPTFAPLFRWTLSLPTYPGRWWMKVSEDADPKVVRVWRAQGDKELSYRYGPSSDDINYCCNPHAWWSHRSIPVPEEPVGGLPPPGSVEEDDEEGV